MNNAKDENLERILDGKPELAHTLAEVEQEATRRAVETNIAQIVCMGAGGELCIRVGDDYQDDKGTLKALVYCFTNGKRSDIEQ